MATIGFTYLQQMHIKTGSFLSKSTEITNLRFNHCITCESLYDKFCDVAYKKTTMDLNAISQQFDIDVKIQRCQLKLSFLPDYRSPCWFEHLNCNKPYTNITKNIYFKYFARQLKNQHTYREYFNRNTRYFKYKCSNGEHLRIRCLPSFYMIGVFKSGTTSLWRSLAQHPLIVGPPHKEPQYWNSVRDGGGLHFFKWPKSMDLLSDVPVPRPIKAYVELFDGAAERAKSTVENKNNRTTYHPTAIGEASTTYLTELDKWEMIPGNEGLDAPKIVLPHILKSLTPNVKIIAMLRNPIKRLYSQYLFYEKSMKKSPANFHLLVSRALKLMRECLDTRSLRSCVYDTKIANSTPPIALRHSLYMPFVQDWKAVFGDDFLVIPSERFYAHPIETEFKLCHFLGLDSFKKSKKPRVRNNNRRAYKKNGTMQNRTRALLSEFFHPYNKQLSEFLEDEAFLWR